MNTLVSFDIAMTATEKYEAGYPKFRALFNLKRDDLVTVLKRVLSEHHGAMEILNNKPSVKKTIVNDIEEEIFISFYATIHIDPFGIRYKPEHGSYDYLVHFNNFFTLEPALNEL